MNQFYISIISLGIILVVFAMVWILFDKKKSVDYSEKMDDKKEELQEVITDAEEMVQELNKFSDYIVSQMESKNEEILNNLKEFEERVQKINAAVNEKVDFKGNVKKKVVNGSVSDVQTMQGGPIHNLNSDLIIENMEFNHAHVKYSSPGGKQATRRSEKIIPINGRYREILQLYQNGLSDTEIAKAMNMGKGEIQLILELNK